MGFIDETSRLLGIDHTTKPKTFCYLSPSYGVIIEGYSKIYELSDSKITVLCDDSRKLEILGTGLSIKEIAHKEISIKGQINSLNFI